MTFAPFDPDFDADNPFITDVPERFVAELDPEFNDDFEDAFGAFAEATFDPDFEGFEDAGFEEALFGDC